MDFDEIQSEYDNAAFNHRFEQIAAILSWTTEALILSFNVIAIIVIWKRRQRSKLLEPLFVALSLSEIFSILLPSPLGIAAYFLKRWPGGSLTCRLYQLCLSWFPLTSLCLVTCTCYQGLMALRGVLNFSLHRETLQSTSFIMLSYLFGLIISCLPLFGLAADSFETSHGHHCSSWLLAKPSESLQFVFPGIYICIAMSTLVTSALTSLLLRRLCRQCKRLYDVNSRQIEIPEANKKTLQRYGYLGALLAAIYIILWLPTLIILSVENIFGKSIPPVLLIYSLWATSLCGILMPLAYLRSAGVWRQVCLRMARHWRPIRESESTSSEVSASQFSSLSGTSLLHLESKRTVTFPNDSYLLIEDTERADAQSS